MKISIITTVYKAENDLPKLLESMMAQKSQELEFFLIDNGSPDRCGEICQEYAKKDSRFKVYSIKENIGYIKARNLGIKECSGDYIGFCDSDDYLENGGYDRAIEKIKESNCDLYIAAYRTISENQQFVNNNPFDKGIFKDGKIREFILPQAFGPIDGKPMLHGFAWKQIFKRSIILENSLEFFSELQPYEDQIFNIDVIKKSNIICIDDNIIYNYIVNEQSITAKLIANFDAEVEWNRIKLLWLQKKSRISEPQHLTACNNQALFSIYSMILNITKTNRKSIREMSEYFNSIIDEDKGIIQEIMENSSENNGRRLDFIKKCLLKQKYSRIFLVINVALKIRK